MSRAGHLRNLRDTVAGSGSIIDWARVADEVRRLGGLPGDAGALRAVAATLRGGGNEIDTVRKDLDTVRRGKLPRVWTGLSAIAATTAVDALTNRMADVDQVFRDGAVAVERLADGVEQAQRRDTNGRAAVQAGIAMQAQLGPADYRRIQEAMVHGLDDMIGAATQHETACLDATRRLRGIAGLATASKMDTTTLSPIEKVLMAAADDGAGSILTASDAAQAAKNLNGWDFAARMRFVDLLESCVTDDERAWLLKAVGAGHTIDEIAAFDATIRAHAGDAAWIQSHLRPLDPHSPGDAYFRGVSLTQFDGTTCGTMSLLVQHAMRDPLYALQLSHVDPPQSPADEQRIISDRLVSEQKRIHGETTGNPLLGEWPAWLGTHPADMADWLSDHSGGVQYDWHRSVATTADTGDQVMSTVTAAAAGNPSMLVIGNNYPDHYVMVVGETAGGAMVYNPATGRVTEVPIGDLTHEHLAAVSNRDSVYAVVTPR